MATLASPLLSPSQQALADLWDAHVRHEFATRDTDHTLATMVEDASVNHVPVLTGGTGLKELRAFYSRHFIPRMPPDLEILPVSRTVGNDRLVDEMILRFTHTVRMDWALPGVEPTGRRVELPLLVVVQFRGDKLAAERIYWDQASLLVQVGLLRPEGLPVAGVESARKVLDPSLPSNELIERGEQAT
jgi:carboxymethylenebutenolidase